MPGGARAVASSLPSHLRNSADRRSKVRTAPHIPCPAAIDTGASVKPNHVGSDVAGTVATGAAILRFSNTSATPGHAATGTRGRAAAGAATPIHSDTSNKLLSDFMLHAPFLIGPVQDRLCGARGFPKCHLRAAGPTWAS